MSLSNKLMHLTVAGGIFLALAVGCEAEEYEEEDRLGVIPVAS